MLNAQAVLLSAVEQWSSRAIDLALRKFSDVERGFCHHSWGRVGGSDCVFSG